MIWIYHFSQPLPAYRSDCDNVGPSKLKNISAAMLSQYKTKSGRPITIGYGVGTKWFDAKQQTQSSELYEPVIDQVTTAINCGFNHIDTAHIYNTARETSRGIKNSGVDRQDLWITSKFTPFTSPNCSFQLISLTEAFNNLLEELDTDYFDLFLVHDPFLDPRSKYSVEDLWRQLVDLKNTGKVRFIGVSNFRIEDIEKCKEIYEPEFNQIEFHPNLQNQSPNIRDFCDKNNITVQGYNPLCSLYKFEDKQLKEFIDSLVKKYNKTNTQILLKYTLQSNVLPITTSSKQLRMQQALQLDFNLQPNEIEKINKIGGENHQRSFFVQNFEN